MKKKILSDNRGFTGWVIVTAILVFAVAVGIFIVAARDDKTREYQVCEERVKTMVWEKYGFYPAMESETARDYGDVLVAVRFKTDSPELEYRAGSYLFNISDNSQQVYNVSEEYPYDYDFASAAHRFAADWGVTRRDA